jgi:hypothetical protein
MESGTTFKLIINSVGKLSPSLFFASSKEKLTAHLYKRTLGWYRIIWCYRYDIIV